MGKVYSLQWQEWLCFCTTFEQSAMNVGRRKLFSGPFQPPAVFERLCSANVKTHEDHIGATVGKPNQMVAIWLYLLIVTCDPCDGLQMCPITSG